MTKATLPQAERSCSELVLDILRASSTPLSMRQINAAARDISLFSGTEIRAAVFELEADELVDSEKFRADPKLVYFLIDRAPFGATWTPADKVQPIGALVQRQWFSPLGLAA